MLLVGHVQYLNHASLDAIRKIIGYVFGAALILNRHTCLLHIWGRSDDEVIARANEWLYAIGADSVHVSPLADSITARFLNDDNRAWQHLPPSVSHPLAFDFVIRRDAGLNDMENSKKARAQKPDATYTVICCCGFCRCFFPSACSTDSVI